jgi:hypothetical protein
LIHALAREAEVLGQPRLVSGSEGATLEHVLDSHPQAFYPFGIAFRRHSVSLPFGKNAERTSAIGERIT